MARSWLGERSSERRTADTPARVPAPQLETHRFAGLPTSHEIVSVGRQEEVAIFRREDGCAVESVEVHTANADEDEPERDRS